MEMICAYAVVPTGGRRGLGSKLWALVFFAYDSTVMVEPPFWSLEKVFILFPILLDFRKLTSVNDVGPVWDFGSVETVPCLHVYMKHGPIRWAIPPSTVCFRSICEGNQRPTLWRWQLKPIFITMCLANIFCHVLPALPFRRKYFFMRQLESGWENPFQPDISS